MNPLILVAFGGSRRGFNVLLMLKCRPIHYSSSVGVEEERRSLGIIAAAGKHGHTQVGRG
jgi:hypothetical protein